MPIWPANLPQRFLAAGYSETMPDNVLRTQMDQGPDKVRRKSTDGVWEFSGTMRMTGVQLESFLDFYRDTLKEVAKFNFPHPRKGTPIMVRFAKAPSYQPVSASGPWDVSIAIEQSP